MIYIDVLVADPLLQFTSIDVGSLSTAVILISLLDHFLGLSLVISR